MEYLERYKHKNDIVKLYDDLNWKQHIAVSDEGLITAMAQSWHVIYVYEDKQLIGTGRVVSDGLINGYICGIGVSEAYRGIGIGGKILKRLVEKCKENDISTQLLCNEELVSYYQKKGFDVFTVGMKYFNK